MVDRMERWIPVVRRVARKARDVSLVYQARDIEQEVWVQIAKNWDPPGKRGLKDVPDRLIEPTVKVIMRNRTFDIIRSQMRRPDTNWGLKSGVVDQLLEAADPRKPAVASELRQGRSGVQGGSLSRYLSVPDGGRREESEARAAAGKQSIRLVSHRREVGAFCGDQHSPGSDWDRLEAESEILEALDGMVRGAWEDAEASNSLEDLQRLEDAEELAYRVLAILDGEDHVASPGLARKHVGASKPCWREFVSALQGRGLVA